MSKEIVPIHIDLSKGDQINESFLLMFGTAIKMILQRMFGSSLYIPDVSISGSPSQVQSFVSALAGEKRYFDSYVKHGLNDPRTHKDYSTLKVAVDKFERDTGIKWPFK
jgi:hypothetical protein